MATHVSHAKRLSQGADLLTREDTTSGSAGTNAPMARMIFIRRESAKPQARAHFAVVAQGAAKQPLLARPRWEAWVHLAAESFPVWIRQLVRPEGAASAPAELFVFPRVQRVP
jgi:hypothetical protein